MVLSTEQLKDLFRNNKENFIGFTFVFRANGNQKSIKTLNAAGLEILELAKKTENFEIGQIWKTKRTSEILGAPESMDELIKLIESKEINAFSISPFRVLTECEQIRAGGSLD